MVSTVRPRSEDIDVITTLQGRIHARRKCAHMAKSVALPVISSFGSRQRKKKTCRIFFLRQRSSQRRAHLRSVRGCSLDGCSGQRMLLEHEWYYGLGMDALVSVCSCFGGWCPLLSAVQRRPPVPLHGQLHGVRLHPVRRPAFRLHGTCCFEAQRSAGGSP